jgi:hypothetical protein
MYGGKRLDITGGKDEEGQNIQMNKPSKASSQKWKLVYADKMKPVQMKGLNKKFGLEVNRPFFIVSKMWMNRVAECVGASNIVLKTLVRTNLGQQFFFDGASKTIKSNQWKDRSITLQGNNLYMTTTNARWFQLFKLKGQNLVNMKGKLIEVVGQVDNENRNIGVNSAKGGMG